MEPKRIIHGLLTALLLAAPAGADNSVSLDPALRPLLRLTPREARETLATASVGRKLPVPRSLLLAGFSAQDQTLELFVTAERHPSGQGVAAIPLGEDLYAVRATMEGLRSLVEAREVTAVRLSRPLFPALDRSTDFLGMNQVRTQDLGTGELSGLTGKGVVVGFVDTGLDWSHPDFQNEDGSTRILTYWDQTANLGKSPEGFDFGVEWTSVSIDGGVSGGFDRNGHGTHVAGIALGNGRSSRNDEGRPIYTGLAPEATAIVVKTNFTEFGAAVGARYVFARAAERGMPVVVNLSLGNHFGPHRGDTPLERSFSSNVGPGRIIVAAAGNDGARPFHAEMHLAAGESQDLRFEVPSYQKVPNEISYVALEGWFPKGARYRFAVLNPDGEETGSFRFGDEESVFPDRRGYVRGWYVEDQGMTNLFLDVEDNLQSVRRATGTWTLRVESLSGSETELDFWFVSWFSKGTGELPGFASHVDIEETVLSPASASRILAVGAMATRACWPTGRGGEACYDAPPVLGEVAPFSALGPTSDGRAKPEILAPGFGVVAPRSTKLSSAFYTEEEIVHLSTPDGLYWINRGTSMAAPHAAGTAALLLERYPEMTVEQMRGRLLARSPRIEDARTGEFVHVLRTGKVVAPIVDLTLSEIRPGPGGIRLRWFVGKELEPVRYEVWKGFDEEGPFFTLSDERIVGGNPFEIVDPRPEPGRRNLFRIVAVDGVGLEDDLDTLSTLVEGVPELLLRPPDPNPARGPVNLRFFAPPSAGGAHFRLDVFDAQGRLVRRLESGVIGAEGLERLTQWDVRDEAGRRIPGGLYFVRLEFDAVPSSGGSVAPDGVFTRRVVVLP